MPSCVARPGSISRQAMSNGEPVGADHSDDRDEGSKSAVLGERRYGARACRRRSVILVFSRDEVRAISSDQIVVTQWLTDYADYPDHLAACAMRDAQAHHRRTGRLDATPDCDADEKPVTP
jgi:hypothetical protein